MDLITLYPDIYSNPAKWSGKRTDFHTDEDLTEYSVTAVNLGTAAVIDTASTGLNGVAQLGTSTATASKGADMQRDALTLGFVPNRTTLFSFGFNITEATDSIFVGGLVGATDTDTLGGIADGFQFKKADAATALQGLFRASSATIWSNTSLLTVAASTQYVCTMVCKGGTVAGTGSIYLYVNNVAYVPGETLTNLPASASVALGEHVAFTSGAANAASKYMNLDFIEAWTSRVKVD